MENQKPEKTTFERIVKPILNYVGLIGAIICTIAYIIAVFVLINGFKIEDMLKTTVFAIVTAAVGFCVMQFLKVQGQSFAAMIPENIGIIKQYYMHKTKDKVNHSMRYFWITSVIKDIFTKCVTLAFTTIGVIYIVIEGSKDYNLIRLAIVNILMFVCFGLLALTKAYDYYNNSYIPYIIDRLNEGEKDVCLKSTVKNS